VTITAQKEDADKKRKSTSKTGQAPSVGFKLTTVQENVVQSFDFPGVCVIGL